MLILAADPSLLYPMHGPGWQSPSTSLIEPAPVRCGDRSSLFGGGEVHLGIPHLCERAHLRPTASCLFERRKKKSGAQPGSVEGRDYSKLQ